MEKAQKWLEESFVPWKEKAKENERMLVVFEQRIKENAAEVKYIVTLLIEGETEKAVRLWNNLALEPMLQSIKIDMRANNVTFVPYSGNMFDISLSVMIRELQALLDG